MDLFEKFKPGTKPGLLEFQERHQQGHCLKRLLYGSHRKLAS